MGRYTRRQIAEQNLFVHEHNENQKWYSYRAVFCIGYVYLLCRRVIVRVIIIYNDGYDDRIYESARPGDTPFNEQNCFNFV